jgi:hypothetical protein
MLWDLIQQAQISDAKWKAQDAKSAAANAQQTMRHLQSQLHTLEERFERLSLASMAVAEILFDRLSVTQAEIETKVQEIDLRDGKLDGRLRPATNDCSHCRHLNAAHRRKCLYCGESLATDSGLFPSPAKHERGGV